MFYITNNDETKFLQVDGTIKNLVNSISKATRFSSQSAACHALVSLPQRFHKKTTLKVVEISPIKDVTEQAAELISPHETPELKADVKLVDAAEISRLTDSFKTTSETLTQIKNSKATYCEKLSECDKEIQVILHDLEDMRFSASQGYKILREIQTLRKKRREIKNSIKVTDLISDRTITEIGNLCDFLEKAPTLRYNPNK